MVNVYLIKCQRLFEKAAWRWLDGSTLFVDWKVFGLGEDFFCSWRNSELEKVEIDILARKYLKFSSQSRNCGFFT
jgi:hypothetical protein